jgi:hypothetical protein
VPWRFSDAGRRSVGLGRRSRRPKTCTDSVIRRCRFDVRFARKRTRLKGTHRLIPCGTLTPAPTPASICGSGPTSSMTRRAISAGPDRSYVVRPRRCYCTIRCTARFPHRFGSASGQNPNASRTLVCQLPPPADIRRIGPSPLRANFGLMHRSKKSSYSITSSARAMSCRGTSIPSAWADLRLMISNAAR